MYAQLSNSGAINEPIQCRERLGGMLNFYYREAVVRNYSSSIRE